MRIVIIFACATTIILQLFRMVWLFRPEFLKNTRYYARREPSPTEKFLYYLMTVATLAYTIVSVYDRL